MNWADMYSQAANGATGVQTLATGPTGPNQSLVTGPGQNPSAGVSAAGAPVAWLGLMLLLVLLYVSIRMGARIS